MYQHGTPIVLNGKLLKNPNLASHYACMRHLGVIYGQTSQSLPPHGYVVLNLKLKQIKAKGNKDLNILIKEKCMYGLEFQ